MANDDQWDFDAPQYRDFLEAKFPGDDNADEYFNFDHENGVPVMLENDSGLDAGSIASEFCSPSSEIRVTRSATKTRLKAHNDETNKTTKSIPECLNLEKLIKKTEEATDTPNKLESMQKNSEVQGRGRTPNQQQGKLLTSKSLSRTPSLKTQTPTGAQSQGRRVTRSQSLRQAPSQRPRPTRSISPGGHHSQKINDDFNKTEEKKTKPKNLFTNLEEWRKGASRKKTNTPNKTNVNKVQTAVKSSEDLEMETIELRKQELAQKRKLAQDSYKLAMKGKVTAGVVNNCKKTTLPEAFKFETDSRIKTHTTDKKNDSDTKDFTCTLRCDTGKQLKTANKLTKVQPFKLSSRKRRLPDLDEKTAEKYESMAERVAQFTRTPQRFKSHVTVGPSETKRGRARSPPGITVGKTPQFETRTRKRPVTAPTREDVEKQEVEEMQKKQFKANPVNKQIFKNSCLGIKKVPTKPATVFEEFHLSSTNRHHEKDKTDESEEHYHFHAKPINNKILKGTVGVKEAKKQAPTVPESPAFALKHRVRIHSEVEEPKEEKRSLRSHIPVHSGIPFVPTYKPKTTGTEPFAFEERDRMKAEEKKRKIQEALEEEKKHREFHANPMPDLEPKLPPKRKLPPTVLQPFNLDTDNRGAKKVEEWGKKIQTELEEQREMARFKATNPTVLDQDPFVPTKENKHTIADISEFDLKTAKRSVLREAYETHKKAKQMEEDEILEQEQRMKEAEEREEYERMRREAVHKANPVKQYKHFKIKESEKPLTEPKTPQFKTDIRLKTRAMHEQNMSAR